MSTDINSILKFEARRQQALISADICTLETLLADELIHIHSTGMVHDKAQFLHHITAMGGFVSIERPCPQVSFVGDMALVVGETHNTVRQITTGDIMTRHGYSTLVLKRGAADWQIVLSQMTPVKN